MVGARVGKIGVVRVGTNVGSRVGAAGFEWIFTCIEKLAHVLPEFFILEWVGGGS